MSVMGSHSIACRVSVDKGFTTEDEEFIERMLILIMHIKKPQLPFYSKSSYNLGTDLVQPVNTLNNIMRKDFHSEQ